MSNGDLLFAIFMLISLIIAGIGYYKAGGKEGLILYAKATLATIWMSMFWGVVFYGACNGGHL